jgi:predicted O-methyltransferase YrrM
MTKSNPASSADPTASVGSLHRREVQQTLDRLHRAARGDYVKFVSLVPRMLLGRLRGQSFDESVPPESMKDLYLPVIRKEGEFLYLTARALGAQTIVEYGTSFAISTIYLAAAARDNGGGAVIGTEIVPEKHAQALANLEEAGLADWADVRLGDAMQTLKETPEPIDLVFLDGWKDLYLPILQLLTPRFRPGTVVLADNIKTFRTALRPYVEYMQSGANGFESTTLSIKDGVEYSVFVG